MWSRRVGRLKWIVLLLLLLMMTMGSSSSTLSVAKFGKSSTSRGGDVRGARSDVCFVMSTTS